MKNMSSTVLVAVLAAPQCWAAEGLVAERTISFHSAQEAARIALDVCRKEGHKVTVTVLDHAARTKVVLSDDGASPHSVQHSLNKAYTALTFNQPSNEFGKRATSNPTGAGSLHLDKIATAGGGLPIRAGNELVGAIGVSGSRGTPAAPGGATDAKCGQAGIDQIARNFQ
ncbi:MAG TPA: heme-binding protein [Burkholderiales bacterium]|nr:heme-binding protein [Burkholderiales bacterium]